MQLHAPELLPRASFSLAIAVFSALLGCGRKLLWRNLLSRKKNEAPVASKIKELYLLRPAPSLSMLSLGNLLRKS